MIQITAAKRKSYLNIYEVSTEMVTFRKYIFYSAAIKGKRQKLNISVSSLVSIMSIPTTLWLVFILFNKSMTNKCQAIIYKDTPSLSTGVMFLEPLCIPNSTWNQISWISESTELQIWLESCGSHVQSCTGASEGYTVSTSYRKASRDLRQPVFQKCISRTSRASDEPVQTSS